MRGNKFFLIALGAVFFVTGCGMEQYTDISVEKNTLVTTGKVYLTSSEKLKFDLWKLTNTSVLRGMGMDDLTWLQETKDGTTYQTTSRTRFYSVNNLMANVILDEDKFVVYSNYDKNSSNLSASSLTGILKSQKPEFFRSVFAFDRNVLDTNGTLEGGDQVVFSSVDEMEKNMIYACFTEKSANCKSITADVGRYTKSSRINFLTDGIITEILADGKEYTPSVYYQADANGENLILHKDYYEFEEEKTCKFKVTLNSGYSETFTFTYDKTAPKIKVKKNKITVTDKGGVKKITLNGKKISSGKKVTKKGTYQVKAWDNAGNAAGYRFKVK